jgi:hypothetical protein
MSYTKTYLLFAAALAVGCAAEGDDMAGPGGCEDGGKCDGAGDNAERDGGLIKPEDRDPENPAYVKVCDDNGDPLGPQFERYCGKFDVVPPVAPGPGVRGFLPPNNELHRSYESMDDAMREGLAGWTLFAAPGKFMRQITVNSGGMINLLAAMDASQTPRDVRFKAYGTLNDPNCRPASGKDQFGLQLDECDDPYSSGLAGFRLMPNPDFDMDQWLMLGGWDGASDMSDAERQSFANEAANRHLSNRRIGGPSPDEEYEIDDEEVRGWEVEPPYLPSLTCGSCHLAPHPLNPPEDVNAPQWDEIAFGIGNQFFWEGNLFATTFDQNSILAEALHKQAMGTSDTSRVATDTIFNPNTINAVQNLLYRPRSWQPNANPATDPSYHNPDVVSSTQECFEFSESNPIKNGCFPLDATGRPLSMQPDEDCVSQCVECVEDSPTGGCVHTFNILKDGADSSGPTGALLRVYINVGACAGDMLAASGGAFTFFAGKRDDQFPINRKGLFDSCPEYAFMADKALPTVSYLLFLKPYLLGDVDADAGPAEAVATVYPEIADDSHWSLVNEDAARRGAEVFANNCATCHSGVQPADDGRHDVRDPGTWFTPERQEFFRDLMARRMDALYASNSPKEFLANDDPAVQNFMSDDRRYPTTILGTNFARAFAQNATTGRIWEEYASLEYQNLQEVREDKVKIPFAPIGDNNFLGGFFIDPKKRPEQIPGTGYYRTSSLQNIWNSAPFLSNNGLGDYDWDDGVPEYTVEGRLKAFRISLEEMLTPESERPVRMSLSSGDSKLALSFLVSWLPDWEIEIGKNSSLAGLVTMTEKLFVNGVGLLPGNLFKGTDPVVNKGHNFGAGIPEEDHAALAAFLLTL